VLDAQGRLAALLLLHVKAAILHSTHMYIVAIK